MEVFRSCHRCCCNGEWKIEVTKHWTARSRAEEKGAPMCCSPWTLVLAFHHKTHSVLGLQTEGASYKSGFCVIDLSRNTMELKAIPPRSDFWSLPHWAGCRSVAGAAGEWIKELFPPGGDGQHVGSSHQVNGLLGKAELRQGAQLCEILPLLARGGDWELARAAVRDPKLQSPCPLAWGDSGAQKRLLPCWGSGKKPNPLAFPSATPLPIGWAPPASSTGAPDTSPLRESSCWEFLPAPLFTVPQLRPDVCSLLSANWQTEASRGLVWCHQTPASSGGGVLPQTMTSVASGHPRTS